MDILLTHGYFMREDPHELTVMTPYPPLGILSISAYLKAAGYHVGVFDSTFRTFSEYADLLERERPPVVGIYVNLLTRSRAVGMSRAAKDRGAIVILGGPEPANYPEEYLRRGADVIVFGEGEAALAELLPALAKNGPHALEHIQGIAYCNDEGRVVRTGARPMIDDLDSLPDPDREAIDINRYLHAWRMHHGAGSLSLICARGCPYHCTWCSHAVYGHTHRRRSPRRVAQEVESIASRYQPDRLWYADDVFTMHHPWLREYAGELKRRALRIPFECISRADRLTEEIADLLADMGCHRLWLGSESGSQRILDAMRRGVTVEQVQSMTRALKRRGIQVGMFIMLGFEGEGDSDLEATVGLLKQANPDVFLTTVAYPIRGTEYYDMISDRITSRGDWQKRTDRDFAVSGRHSRRYYSFATRWIVNSVALRRKGDSGPRVLRLAKAAANTLLGRAGMWLTRGETEGSPPNIRSGVRKSVQS
jgi:anaerobic magnesium-protoporphyrin IX monomethyl ester cyclase